MSKVADRTFWFFCGLAVAVVIFGFVEEDRTPNDLSAGGWAAYFGILGGAFLASFGLMVSRILKWALSGRENHLVGECDR